MKLLRHGRDRSAFTLIELLIVIAVISSLAALLMPALRDAKLRAYDMKCASNERQIHLAIVLYCHDHDNLFPADIAWNTQFRQLGMFSNYVQNRFDLFHCPLSHNDPLYVTDPAPLCRDDDCFRTNINGRVEWTEYKLNDQWQLQGRDFGSQLRPQKVVILIDAHDWAPRHRGKENLCFFDGHVEMVPLGTAEGQYNGPEPGGGPGGWFTWGLM